MVLVPISLLLYNGPIYFSQQISSYFLHIFPLGIDFSPTSQSWWKQGPGLAQKILFGLFHQFKKKKIKYIK